MTKESWNEYQNNYRKNHYTQLSVHLESELVRDFKEQLKKNNIPFATFMRDVIDKYLGKK